MPNVSYVVCPEHLTWLYAGIDYTLEGNGGPECANFLSTKHRLLETMFVLLASVIEVILALKRIKYDDVSSLTPTPAFSTSMNGGPSYHIQSHASEKYVYLLRLFCFIVIICTSTVLFTYGEVDSTSNECKIVFTSLIKLTKNFMTLMLL